MQEKLNKYYQKPDIYSSIAINRASVRLEMTAAQSCFLFEISQSNPLKTVEKKNLLQLNSDETKPQQLLSLVYFLSNKNSIKLVF